MDGESLFASGNGLALILATGRRPSTSSDPKGCQNEMQGSPIDELHVQLGCAFWHFFSSAASSSGLGGARRSPCPAETIPLEEDTLANSHEQLVRNP